MSVDQRLPDAQLAVMQAIWRNGGRAMFSDLAGMLEAGQKNWKPNTVLTLLTRLAERGAVCVEKHGRLNEYIALISEGEYLRMRAGNFVKTVFAGDAKHLVAALVQDNYLTEQDYAELKHFWKEGKDVP